MKVLGAGPAGSENTVFGVQNASGGSIGFIAPYVLNANDPTRMLLASNYLFESTDSGDHFTVLGGGALANLNGDGVDNDGDGNVDEGDEFGIPPAANVGTVDSTGDSKPIAYGGFSGGVQNDAVLWVDAGGQLLVRTSGTGLPTAVPAYALAGGGTVIDIVLDPTDWHTAYVLFLSARMPREVRSRGRCRYYSRGPNESLKELQRLGEAGQADSLCGSHSCLMQNARSEDRRD